MATTITLQPVLCVRILYVQLRYLRAYKYASGVIVFHSGCRPVKGTRYGRIGRLKTRLGMIALVRVKDVAQKP